MSAKLALAASETVWQRIARLRVNSLDVLAPQMRTRVLATLHECEGRGAKLDDGSGIALDVVVHETLRTDELQRIYYEQGASKAPTARYSWHAYGLAVDVISRQYEWFTGGAAKERWPDAVKCERAGNKWFAAVAEIAKRHGLKWGGDWRSLKDYPHLYFGNCKDSPSEVSRSTVAQYNDPAVGRAAVWKLVGAL